MSYDDYAESPVHRFYQMWQQLDCTASLGCRNDLVTWVEETVGAGSNGLPPPANFTYKEGATAMGFYNVQQGDVPYFKQLADSYVQPLDYFGDGTRIPMIVVSNYRKGGHISHTYTDHVSVLKFIEANWGVPPITNRSRDNLPNPTTGADPHKPMNGPAIGDLTDLSNFQ